MPVQPRSAPDAVRHPAWQTSTMACHDGDARLLRIQAGVIRVGKPAGRDAARRLPWALWHCCPHLYETPLSLPCVGLPGRSPTRSARPCPFPGDCHAAIAHMMMSPHDGEKGTLFFAYEYPCGSTRKTLLRDHSRHSLYMARATGQKCSDVGVPEAPVCFPAV